ncbi:MAG: acyl-ACP--UDP-N-acetylglucosamine O-acyltransferase [Gammaproteobacteria bacterium]|nr:acyl-ACP--UDP-N-acetylglucosamine O-acyltransferase [Gammaproteobacteria bacterium]
MIDPRAIVDPSARLGVDVSIGPWTIIGPGVEIGDGTRIAAHVVLKGPTQIGRNNRIFQFSSVGEDTPAFAYQGEPTTLSIGDDNVIREGVTIHRGTAQHTGTTVIGNHNLLMAYVHVGHDCVVGDHVVMANNSSISGHVNLGDWANVGGYAGVPQFRSIGAYTHIAGMSLVLKDVPAFVTVSGHPAGVVGLNEEGMRRRGFSVAVVAALRDAYRTVYRRGHTVQEALSLLSDAAAEFAEVKTFVDSISSSRWGIVRSRGAEGAQV